MFTSYYILIECYSSLSSRARGKRSEFRSQESGARISESHNLPNGGERCEKVGRRGFRAQ